VGEERFAGLTDKALNGKPGSECLLQTDATREISKTEEGRDEEELGKTAQKSVLAAAKGKDRSFERGKKTREKKRVP